MSAVLGMSVSTEGDIDVDQGRGKVFVANHITSFDHLAVHLAASAWMVKNCLVNFRFIVAKCKYFFNRFLAHQGKSSSVYLQAACTHASSI